MPYLVLKPIPVNDGVIPSGEVVDAEEWRNLRTLISGRYLAPEPVPAKAVTAPKREAPVAQPAEAPAEAVTAPKPKAKRTTTQTPTTPTTDEE